MWRPRYFSASSMPQKKPEKCHYPSPERFVLQPRLLLLLLQPRNGTLLTPPSTKTTLHSSSTTNITILKSRSSSRRSSHRKHFQSEVVTKPGSSCCQLPLKSPRRRQSGKQEVNLSLAAAKKICLCHSSGSVIRIILHFHFKRGTEFSLGGLEPQHPSWIISHDSESGWRFVQSPFHISPPLYKPFLRALYQMDARNKFTANHQNNPNKPAHAWANILRDAMHCRLSLSSIISLWAEWRRHATRTFSCITRCMYLHWGLTTRSPASHRHGCAPELMSGCTFHLNARSSLRSALQQVFFSPTLLIPLLFEPNPHSNIL